jgi:Leucine-rich repeat (LRR) protein
MQQIDLSSNILSGDIPLELGQQESLVVLLLSGNRLSGCIPQTVGDLIALKQLALNNNLISSSIPGSFSNLSSLVSLALQFNLIEGVVPSIEAPFANIDLSNNKFVGSVDGLLLNRTNLVSFVVNSNSFSGQFPVVTGNSLQSVNLSSNSFAGTLEDSIFSDLSYANLNSLDLSNNMFSGPIPSGLFALSRLETLSLSQNCFDGEIPFLDLCENPTLTHVLLDSLTQNCGNLIAPSIRWLLHGFIPRQYIDGSIHTCLWNSTSLQLLHLTGNGLPGSLADLAQNSSLSVLALGSNRLTGTIPLSFQLHDFEQLDLSLNKLDGTLSSGLTADPRVVTVYDLSVNRISGEVPSSLFQSFNSSVLNVLQGNVFACSAGHIPSADSSKSSYQCGSETLEYAMIFFYVAFAVVVFIFLVWMRIGRKLVSLYATLLFRKIMKVHAAITLVIMGVTFVLYLSFKLSSSLQGDYSTHAIQYWWTTTAAYMHGWPPVLVIMTVLLVLTALSVNSIVSDQALTLSLDSSTVRWPCRKSALLFFVYTVNTVTALGVNAMYVLLAVNNISGSNLLVLQSTLGIFKVGWRSIAVPKMVALVTTGSDSIIHATIMNLFMFIGAPFSSAFCESSTCFLGLLSLPGTVQSTVSLSALTCGANCNHLCGLNCVEVCLLSCSSEYIPVTFSIVPPWLYSYQCSSAVITNYAPVLEVSFTISGIILPIFTCWLLSHDDVINRLMPTLKTWRLDGIVFCADPQAALSLYKQGGPNHHFENRLCAWVDVLGNSNGFKQCPQGLLFQDCLLSLNFIYHNISNCSLVF